MENKIDILIDSVLETSTVYQDNPNGGHVYSCPFCYSQLEVKADRSICMGELRHLGDCAYKLAQELYNLRS